MVRPIPQGLGGTGSWSCLIAVVRVWGFGLSHHEVKRAVALIIGFVFTIASALCGFLYLKQRIHDKKKKREKTSLLFA